MKRIPDIRRAISGIEGVFLEIPPGDILRGHAPGLSSRLWDPTIAQREINHNRLHVESDEGDVEVGEGSQLEEIFEIPAVIDLGKAERVLRGVEGEKIRTAIQIQGVDALAWYVPFHIKSALWGIYIPVSSIAYMILRVFGEVSAPVDAKIRMAFRAFHQHELFHFSTEYMASQWEGILGKPCYLPSKSLKDPKLGYNPLEEQCANASMIRSFWGRRSVVKGTGKTEALREFVQNQPYGYREGGRTTSFDAFSDRCASLVDDYTIGIRGFDRSRFGGVDLLSMYPSFPIIDWKYCPIHLINDGARFGFPKDLISFFYRIEGKIEETENFLKQLAKAHSRVQDAWERAKERLRVSTAGKGLDFKLWKKETDQKIYSIRLSRSHRAHLVYRESIRQWIAISIGSHTEMGHG